MIPMVNERHLYMCFKELLASDLVLSSRVASTGSLPLLCDVLSYCFSTIDTELHHPAYLDVASHLCRTDCSIYCKNVYVQGVA